ncbi:hypothetical protein [Hyphomicrobium sp. DY-1]|uniref:hypothetical protein n=1 Tax=Hyphomicrobium sp. DY-1 TaxID=3075650 RepID=UPI0039C27A52
MLTVLAELGAVGRVEDGEQDQAEMFQADAEMPSMLPESPARSGPRGGRPRGSRNKSTEQWRELFLSKYRHPMMTLGELTSMTPADLARALGLYMYSEGKPVMHPRLDANGEHARDGDGNLLYDHALATGEAARMQKDAAIALLPYLGQKLPMAIEITPPKRGVVVIGDLPVETAGGDLDVPFAPEPQSEQNQRVIEGEIVRPEGEQSHAEPKPVKELGVFEDDV